jgi:hypothetical protein
VGSRGEAVAARGVSVGNEGRGETRAAEGGVKADSTSSSSPSSTEQQGQKEQQEERNRRVKVFMWL